MYNFEAFANDPEILEGIETYFKEKEETPKEYSDKLLAFADIVNEINAKYLSAQKEIKNAKELKAKFYYNELKKYLHKYPSLIHESLYTIKSNKYEPSHTIIKVIDGIIKLVEEIYNYLSYIISKRYHFHNKMAEKISIILNKYNILDFGEHIKNDLKPSEISNELINDLKTFINFINRNKDTEINILNSLNYSYDNEKYPIAIEELYNSLYRHSKDIQEYFSDLLILPISLRFSIEEPNLKKTNSKLIQEFYEIYAKIPDLVKYEINSNRYAYSFILTNEHDIKIAITNIIEILKTSNILKSLNILEPILKVVNGFEILNKYLIKNNFNTTDLKEIIKLNDANHIVRAIHKINSSTSEEFNQDSIKALLLLFLKKFNYDNNTAKLILRHSNNIVLKANLLLLLSGSENLNIFLFLFKSLKTKDHNFILKILSTINPNNIYFNTFNKFLSIVEKAIPIYITNEHFYKTLNQIQAIDELIHNNFNISDKQTESFVEFFILNKIDPNQDIIKKIFLIVNKPQYKSIIKDNIFFSLCAKLKINGENLIKNYNELAELFSTNKITSIKHVSPELKEKVNKLSTDLEMLINYETIYQYIDKAKPKNPNLFKLNYQINDHLHFKVLEDLSYNHFTIGTDTDCCQRIGGAGEEAAIDSFINPLAGVLILYFNSDVISQSYFHYVPQDNGIILDNVEINEKNVKKYNINLDEIYAALAQKAKQDMNLKYFRCGLDYNNLNSKQFSKKRLPEDPREFSVSNPYSDFDENKNLDLLAPKFKVNPTLLESFKLTQAYSLQTVHTILKLGNLKHLHRFL